MRKSRVLLAGVAVAAAAAATSAFTAANTVPPSVAGYGQNAVTGANVTSIDYVSDPADAAILAAVEFTTTTNVTGATSTMVLRSGVAPNGSGGSDVGDPYACTVKTAWADDDVEVPGVGSMVLTCDTTAVDPTFASFNGVGLTVVS
jgi:hypothetical protein